MIYLDQHHLHMKQKTSTDDVRSSDIVICLSQNFDVDLRHISCMLYLKLYSKK